MVKMMLFSLSSSVIFSKNQMTMVVLIIMSCVTMAAWMFLMTNIHWFSVLILLIYISGVMVLFMFIVSMSPNEKTSMKVNKKLMALMIMVIYMTKMNLESENLKINSSVEWSLYSMTLTVAVITLMAYLPPKLIKSLYSGMKSTK